MTGGASRPSIISRRARQMRALFADLEEATANTLEIARRVSFRPQTRKPIMPRFIHETPDHVPLDEIEAAELRRQAIEGLEERLAAHGPAEGRTREEYAARLDFELSVIEKMRFPGYFLIVSDFIKYAKSQRHSGRTGTRLRRRFARRLCPDHHRSRSAALRPVLRTLS